MNFFSPTPIQRKILQFFRAHPHAVETVRGMASFLAAEPKAIEEAVGELVHQRWLSCHESSAVSGYALTADDRVLGRIHSLLEGKSL
ncbi:MAG: hypothetical protein HYZ90_01065 [Candidatus Omnitrophica bacterium]|nr:hypothetical protein [Candidatus Omnitrophota bacterium]